SPDLPYTRYRPSGPRSTSGLLVRASSTSSGEMPCRLMCAVFPPPSSALSHSKLSIRTGSPHLDRISFVFTLSIPTCRRTRYYLERMLHGTQKLLGSTLSDRRLA